MMMSKIWDTLDKCHMKEEVERAGGLEVIVKESGTFSVGQRWLLCLAHAFLKSSKMLCLDECTTNIDTPMALVLHSIIATECRGMTVVIVKESGTFSVGQRQLLCLAHAFLKSSKVLCLDECTIKIDTPTALVLHSIIATECRGMTVITIAHRISTIVGMDEIMVLDQGILDTGLEESFGGFLERVSEAVIFPEEERRVCG
ncbi:hypothetical protein Droror1_Dr00017491 [Drosera rotundifolia]